MALQPLRYKDWRTLSSAGPKWMNIYAATSCESALNAL